MNIPNSKYLGKLCKGGHEYLDTGKSLYYKLGYNCVECAKLNRKKQSNTEKYKEWQKFYASSEKYKKLNKKLQRRYREKNAGNIKKMHKKYTDTEKFRKIAREKTRIERKELKDAYIKQILCQKNKLTRSMIPNELVELKRAQLKLTRSTRRAK